MTRVARRHRNWSSGCLGGRGSLHLFQGSDRGPSQGPNHTKLCGFTTNGINGADAREGGCINCLRVPPSTTRPFSQNARPQGRVLKGKMTFREVPPRRGSILYLSDHFSCLFFFGGEGQVSTYLIFPAELICAISFPVVFFKHRFCVKRMSSSFMEPRNQLSEAIRPADMNMIFKFNFHFRERQSKRDPFTTHL